MATSIAQAPADAKFYRVKGLPVDYTSSEDVTELLGWAFGAGCEPKVRSLASDVSSSRAALVAIVAFTSIPDYINNGEQRWALPEPHSGVVIDKAFLELTPLNDLDPEDDAPAYCIAITGLSSHPFGSWKAKGRPYMWLNDSLKNQLEHVQILLYGYDSQLEDSHSFQSIGDIAKRLANSLRTLVELRFNRLKQPPGIFFLAHSLGGIVLKSAINQLSLSDGISRSIVSSIIGILFFGVPHRGLNVDEWLSIVKGHPNKDLIENLKPSSRYLKKLQRDFNRAIRNPDVEIISYYETQETKVLQRGDDGETREGAPRALVEKNSAIYEDGFEMGKSFPIPNKDHRNMIKFSDPQDDDYLRVSEYLRNLHRKLVNLRSIVPGPSDYKTWKEELKQPGWNNEPERVAGAGKFTSSFIWRAAKSTLNTSARKAMENFYWRSASKRREALRHRADTNLPVGNRVYDDRPFQSEDDPGRDLWREEYHNKRLHSIQAQGGLQQEAVRSIRDLGKFAILPDKEGSDGRSPANNRPHLLGDLHDEALGLTDGIITERPNDVMRQWTGSVYKDELGTVARLEVVRSENDYMIDEFPAGIGSIPHVEPPRDGEEQWVKYCVFFCSSHPVSVVNSGKTQVFSGFEPKYRFQTKTDFETFQSALFGKELLDSMNVKKVESNEGPECEMQTLRLWSKHGRDTILFFTNLRPGTGPHSKRQGYWEIAVDSFEADISKLPMKPGAPLKLLVKQDLLLSPPKSQSDRPYLQISFNHDEDRDDFVYWCFPIHQKRLDATSRRPTFSKHSPKPSPLVSPQEQSPIEQVRRPSASWGNARRSSMR